MGSRTSHYENFTLLCEKTGDDLKGCGPTAGGVQLHNMQYSNFQRSEETNKNPKVSVTTSKYSLVSKDSHIEIRVLQNKDPTSHTALYRT